MNFIKRVVKSRIFLVILLILIVVAIPLTVYIAQQQQETRQQAAETTQINLVQNGNFTNGLTNWETAGILGVTHTVKNNVQSAQLNTNYKCHDRPVGAFAQIVQKIKVPENAENLVLSFDWTQDGYDVAFGISSGIFWDPLELYIFPESTSPDSTNDTPLRRYGIPHRNIEFKDSNADGTCPKEDYSVISGSEAIPLNNFAGKTLWLVFRQVNGGPRFNHAQLRNNDAFISNVKLLATIPSSSNQPLISTLSEASNLKANCNNNPCTSLTASWNNPQTTVYWNIVKLTNKTTGVRHSKWTRSESVTFTDVTPNQTYDFSVTSYGTDFTKCNLETTYIGPSGNTDGECTGQNKTDAINWYQSGQKSPEVGSPEFSTAFPAGTKATGTATATNCTVSGTITDPEYKAGQDPLAVDFWLGGQSLNKPDAKGKTYTKLYYKDGNTCKEWGDNVYLGQAQAIPSSNQASGNFTFNGNTQVPANSQDGEYYDASCTQLVNPQDFLFKGTPLTITAYFIDLGLDGKRNSSQIPWDQLNKTTVSLTCQSTIPVSTTPPATPTQSTVPPIPTIGPYGSVSFSFSLRGVGIPGGNCTGKDCIDNPNPTHAERTSMLCLYAQGKGAANDPDCNNATYRLPINTAGNSFGSAIFNPTTKLFAGSFGLPAGFTSGTYDVLLKVKNFLRKRVSANQQITVGQVNQLPQTRIVAMDLNSDNTLNILDYNIFWNCLNKKAACTDIVPSDLNDDGVVDIKDLTIFGTSFQNQSGD